MSTAADLGSACSGTPSRASEAAAMKALPAKWRSGNEAVKLVG